MEQSARTSGRRSVGMHVGRRFGDVLVCLEADEELTWFFNQAGEIALLPMCTTLTGKPEHSPSDHSRTLSRFHHALECLLLLAHVGISHSEFGGIDDRGQDIIEFVGNTGSQFANATQPLGLEQLLTECFHFTHWCQHIFDGHECISRVPLRLSGFAQTRHHLQVAVSGLPEFNHNLVLLHLPANGIGHIAKNTSYEPHNRNLLPL